MSIALSLAPGVHATLTLAEQEAALREVRETLTAEGGEGGAGDILIGAWVQIVYYK